MFSLLLLTFVIACGSTILFILHKLNIFRTLNLAKQFDGPPAQFLIGNAKLFVFKSTAEIFKICCYVMANYKSPRLWDGNTLTVFLKDPKDVEEVLSSMKYIEKSKQYNYLKPWLNDGLLLSTDQKWTLRRKILTPAFHFKILEQYVEIMNRNSKILVDCMAKTFKPNEKCDILDLLSMCALDIICESSMGISINAMKCQNSEYIKAVKWMTELVQKQMFSVLLRYDFFFQFTKEYRDQKKCLKLLHGFTDKVIADRREEITKNGHNIYNDFDTNDIGVKRKMAFLDILLQSTDGYGKPLTNLDIREEVDTFMFEGHDTVTAALLFLFYHIAKYPDVQEKCFKEVRDLVFNDLETPITINMLNQMHYSDLVIKESLRLFPPVVTYARAVTKECTINGKTYPVGSVISLIPYCMQRSENVYPNATKFQPERFAGHNDGMSGRPTNPFAYIPFSAGPRNCIGQKFAMLELKSVLMNVVLNYEIELDADSYDEIEIKAEIVISPAKPIYFHLKPRVLKK